MPSKNRNHYLTGLQKKPIFPYSSASGATNYHQLAFLQGPLSQNNQGGNGCGMFLAHGNKRSTSCFFSVTSKKSRNPKCRKFSLSPPSSEKFDFSIKPLRVFHSGTASILSSEFGEDNKQSVYSKPQFKGFKSHSCQNQRKFRLYMRFQ